MGKNTEELLAEEAAEKAAAAATSTPQTETVETAPSTTTEPVGTQGE